MYAHREVLILEDLQKIVLNKPLPLALGQSVEVLIVADYTISPSSNSTWLAFFTQRDRLLAEQPNEVKEFMSARPQSREQHAYDPFEGWKE